jgi:uncharacterized protein YfaP (DUF2135 family)
MTKKHIGLISGLSVVALIGLFIATYWTGSGQSNKTAATAPSIANRDKGPVSDSVDTASSANSASTAQQSVAPTQIRVGAVSFATTSRPHVSIVGGQKVAYPGLFSEARITVGGKTYDSTPNQFGQFQRVYIEAKAKVSIQVAYPDGSAGDPVAVEVEDGGELGNKTMGSVVKLDDQKTAQFQFLAGDQEGIYRVVLRNGADVKTVNLWVGQETASK